jgi:hypothetical protein
MSIFPHRAVIPKQMNVPVPAVIATVCAFSKQKHRTNNNPLRVILEAPIGAEESKGGNGSCESQINKTKQSVPLILSLRDHHGVAMRRSNHSHHFIVTPMNVYVHVNSCGQRVTE